MAETGYARELSPLNVQGEGRYAASSRSIQRPKGVRLSAMLGVFWSIKNSEWVGFGFTAEFVRIVTTNRNWQ